MFFKYLVQVKGKTVSKCSTHSKRVFSKKIRTINWKKAGIKVLLKIGYGSGFFNVGIYECKSDLLLAYKAFIEK